MAPQSVLYSNECRQRKKHPSYILYKDIYLWVYVEKNINDSFLFIKIFIYEYAYNKNIENNSDLKGISLKKRRGFMF